MKEKEIKTKYLWKAIGISLIVINILLLVLAMGFLFTDKFNEDFGGDFISSKKSSSSKDIVFGKVTAPVTVTIYTDFECPFCKKFYLGAYKQIVSEYVETGKVKIVFKNFPLVKIHPDALRAAVALECANEQGKAKAMHDALFETESLSAVSIKALAVGAGVDSKKFDVCLDAMRYEAKVYTDISQGSSLGVSGTPTIFIDSDKIVGAQPFDVFKKAIDAKLVQ